MLSTHSPSFVRRANSGGYLGYKMGLPEEKRDLLKILTSNREVDGKNVDFTLSLPFSEVVNRFQNSNGSADGIRTRDFLDENQASWTRLDDGAI